MPLVRLKRVMIIRKLVNGIGVLVKLEGVQETHLCTVQVSTGRPVL